MAVTRKKLFFASVGIGVLTTVLFVFLVLFLRALAPGMFGKYVIWAFLWPFPLLVQPLCLSENRAVFLTLTLAILADITFFSTLTYWTLRALRRLTKQNQNLATPPQPPIF
jgi:hypothetical protein